jgi:hypothetical protein
MKRVVTDVYAGRRVFERYSQGVDSIGRFPVETKVEQGKYFEKIHLGRALTLQKFATKLEKRPILGTPMNLK